MKDFQAMRWRLIATAFLASLLTWAGACSNDDDNGPITTSTSTTKAPTTSTTLTPKQEVEQAYLRSWEVLAKAGRNLDPTDLEKVYAKEALRLRLTEIEELKKANTPVHTEVEHNYKIVFRTPDQALVSDSYRNHSVFIDPKTGQPVEPDPNEILHEVYTMERLGGQWKVVFIARSQ
jgi:hypothetical protein